MKKIVLMNLRLKLLLLFMGIFTVLFQLGSYSTVTEDEANQFLNEIKKQIQGIDGIGIWLHNLQVAVIMFVPFGFIIGGFIAFQTGWAVSASTIFNPDLAQLPAFLLLFLTPFGVMELISYGIAMSRSVLLVQALIKKRIRTQVKPLIKEMAIVTGLLLLGGLIEFAMIQWASEQGVNLL